MSDPDYLDAKDLENLFERYSTALYVCDTCGKTALGEDCKVNPFGRIEISFDGSLGKFECDAGGCKGMMQPIEWPV
jgi:hypothetical protein